MKVLQWNLHITNLYITKSSKVNNFLHPSNSKMYMKMNLYFMKPLYSNQILPANQTPSAQGNLNFI